MNCTNMFRPARRFSATVCHIDWWRGGPNRTSTKTDIVQLSIIFLFIYSFQTVRCNVAGTESPISENMLPARRRILFYWSVSESSQHKKPDFAAAAAEFRASRLNSKLRRSSLVSASALMQHMKTNRYCQPREPDQRGIIFRS